MSYQPVATRILVVHLEALGAVLRATSLLKSIKRKFPRCHITWVTKAPAHKLLANNPLVDQVYTTSVEDLLSLQTLAFDAGFCVDKSRKAFGVMKLVDVGQRYGFEVDSNSGAIIPATQAATELWELGLSNHKKFFVNKKPETQLMNEALELGPYLRDEYLVELTEEEKLLAKKRRQSWLGEKKGIIGINTGCANTISAKRLSVSGHRQLIQELQRRFPEFSIVLLGGPEDADRNEIIAAGLGVIPSPCRLGLRDGLSSVEACDIVISGDSLGMHMGIALRKWMAVWFGPTCAHEIDLYDRGQALVAETPCSPCWKRSCEAPIMCYDRVDFDKLIQIVQRGVQWYISSSKQPSSETSSSASLF